MDAIFIRIIFKEYIPGSAIVHIDVGGISDFERIVCKRTMVVATGFIPAFCVIPPVIRQSGVGKHFQKRI